jgi:outer membrane biogenesis lipoprotein LolB
MKTIRLATLVVIAAALLSGCATTAQKKRGMDDNDARREAFWVGVFSGVVHAFTGGDDEKPAK